ncbi:MAG: LysM peptidoglycan-binding domain-containing protein [Actinobacteria bacterium]|nr:LysM peptidoglycan-binding domain-containing protein [Actinomycetota bacterium]
MANPAKAKLESENGPPIECRFNPSEFKLSKSTQWKAPRAKGKNAQSLRFQQGQSGTLSMTLLLDTTDTGTPVTTHTNALLKLMHVDRNLAGADGSRNKARPPWVRFRWGGFTSFKAVLEKLDLTFTYFSSTGDPLRAKAVVTLKQFEDEDDWPPQNPTSGTPRPHRLHHVQPGETIDRIAATQLGDPTRWRELAEANGIDDPLTIPPSAVLIVPDTQGVPRGR